jgi:hypothetical protein
MPQNQLLSPSLKTKEPLVREAFNREEDSDNPVAVVDSSD